MDKFLTTLGGLFPLAAAAIAATMWLAHLESATAEVEVRVAEVKTAQVDQARRVDLMQESRSVNMQRVATLEEGLRAQKDILKDISAKIDRALMRR